MKRANETEHPQSHTAQPKMPTLVTPSSVPNEVEESNENEE